MEEARASIGKWMAKCNHDRFHEEFERDAESSANT